MKTEIYCLDCNTVFNSKCKHKCPQNPDGADYNSYLDETEDFAVTPEANESSTRGKVLDLNFELLSRAIRLSISLEGDGTSRFPIQELIASSDATPYMIRDDGNILDMAPLYSLNNHKINSFNSSDGNAVHSLDVQIEISRGNSFRADEIYKIGSNEKRISTPSIPEAASVARPSGIDTRTQGNGKQKRFVCDVSCKALSRKDNFQEHYKTHINGSFMQDKMEHEKKKEDSRHKRTSEVLLQVSNSGADEMVMNAAVFDIDPFAGPSHRGDDVPRELSNGSFICPVCKKGFRHKTKLDTHYRVHSGEKSYSCEECDYKSIRKGDLQNHLRTHTGEKPFSCKECDYKCSQKGNLQTHLRTHTGEKPYQCSECGKYFSVSSHRNRHFMNVHNKN